MIRGYSNLGSLIIPVRPESNGYASKDDELSWSAVGVMEYWSDGVLEKAKNLDSTRMSPFITPSLLRPST